mgnify:CR=1 FL=1
MNKYFRSYQDAIKFIRNSGIASVPFKSEIWIYPSIELVWTVTI